MSRPWIAVTLFSLALLFASPAQAETFMPTIYSDGISCPNNCDAHVVFKGVHNGTANASLPSSTRDAPQACVLGQPCRVCFDDSDASCIEAIYRGNGPAKGRFDFTPAFFEATCGKPGIPAALAGKCAGFDRQYRRLTQNAVYCLAEPDAAGCAALIAKAEAVKAEDKVFFDECRALGQNKYNRKYASEPARQREDKCTYEMKGTGGPNSRGETWRRLLPAACQAGAYVDRDGLDCCDGTKMSLGAFGKQCGAYLAPK